MTDADDSYPARSARRRWLQALGSSALLGQSSRADALFDRAKLAFPPAVFDASEGQALVGVLGNGAHRIHVCWSTNESFEAAQVARSEVFELRRSDDFAHAFELLGLSSAATIFYAVYEGDRRLSEIQRFRTPAPARERAEFALAFSGDMEERHRPLRIFDTIAAQHLDAFLHLGDTVYADIPRRDFSPTLAHYRRKHAAIRADRSLQSLMAKTATIATWDDHEIENDAHGGHPAMLEAAQAFREYWPSRSERDTGLYRRLAFGRDLELFVLDTRAFRSPQIMEDGAAKTMLGTAQKMRFLRDYAASRAKFRLIASSVPMHGSSKDAWGNYAAERDEIFAAFRKAHVRDGAKTIALSADYHFAREWPRNEARGIYEFMAGPLAAFLTFEKDNAAKERHTRGNHFVFGERANFGVLRYRPDANGGAINVAYYDDRGQRLHERTIE